MKTASIAVVRVRLHVRPAMMGSRTVMRPTLTAVAHVSPVPPATMGFKTAAKSGLTAVGPALHVPNYRATPCL